MRTLHRAMMGVMMVAILAAAAGVIQPWTQTADAQHGGQHDAAVAAMDPQEMFEAWATELELSATQREALTAPFNDGFAALGKLHRLHSVILYELNDVQKEEFGHMLHQMMGGMSGQTGRHQGGGHN